MATAPDKTKVEAYPADRDRLNELAAQLTARGPGRFGQAEALNVLLTTAAVLAGEAAELGVEIADLRNRLEAREIPAS